MKFVPRQSLGFAYLAITATGWALNFTLMKFLLLDWPPLFSRGLAGLMGAITLALIALFLGESINLPRRLVGRILAESLTNVFAWMGFSTLALLWLPVGQNLLLIYTMPLWATLLAWPINGTKPNRRNVLSLTLGLAGIVLLFIDKRAVFGMEYLIGCILSLGAAVFFALGSVLNRTPIAMPFIARTAWQVGLGSLPMIVLGLSFERPEVSALSPSGFAIMIYMAVVAMALCYLTWFGALRHLAATTASAGLLSVPILGMVFAALLLGEPFGLQQVIALTLTLGGVALAIRSPTPET